MKDFTFRFELGETAFFVDHVLKGEYRSCQICECKGIVELKGRRYKCPECGGKGRVKRISLTAYEVKKLTIGEQRLRIGGPLGSDFVTEEYMCNETGVGTGVLYSVDKLNKDKDIAQKIADRLQKEHEAAQAAKEAEDNENL